MGFYSDFLQSVSENSAAARRMWTGLSAGQRQETTIFDNVSATLRRARIVRMGGDQAEVFLNSTPVEGQDYLQWLRLPYPALFISFDRPVVFTGYLGEYDYQHVCQPDHMPHQCERKSPLVKAVMLTEMSAAQYRGMRVETRGEYDPLVTTLGMEVPGKAERLLQVTFFIPLQDYFLNIHMLTVAVCEDNTLECARTGGWPTRKRMLDWAIHAINFLTSPSVKLVPNASSPELQRARARRGKPPLPGWYEITYRKTIHEYTRSTFSQKLWEHSFRYDVRGHFKRFEHGCLAGRVVWCPPHQRGVKHTLYKPKVYRAVPALLDEVEKPVWTG